MKIYIKLIPFAALILIFNLSGCLLDAPPTESIIATATPISTAAPMLNEWQTLAPGLQRRLYTGINGTSAQLLVLRVDPAHYIFRAHYRSGAPLRVSEWRDTLPDAVVFINSNFFDPEYRVLGLLIEDGVLHGTPYTTRGGMFTVQNGAPRIRSNTQAPYAGEALEQAVQAFPMLVLDGQQAYTYTGPDRITRRTAIGMDSDGRVILMVTPFTGMTLLDLSIFLAESDMNVINAFNLDGGGSTLMMHQMSGANPFMLASVDPVPAILAVYPR